MDFPKRRHMSRRSLLGAGLALSGATGLGGAFGRVSNDATAACAAEYLFGHGTRCRELLYVFIAWFIGGGVVLDGNLFPGQTGYAGSLGQILVPTTRGGRRSLPCGSGVGSAGQAADQRSSDPHLRRQSVKDRPI